MSQATPTLDAYHKWLGIPPAEHFNPASLYPDSPALLGRGELTP